MFIYYVLFGNFHPSHNKNKKIVMLNWTRVLRTDLSLDPARTAAYVANTYVSGNCIELLPIVPTVKKGKLTSPTPS